MSARSNRKGTLTDSGLLDPTRLHPDDAGAHLLRRSRVRMATAGIVCLCIGTAGLAALVLVGQGLGMALGLVYIVPLTLRNLRRVNAPRPARLPGPAPLGPILIAFAAMALATAGQYWVIGAALGVVAGSLVGFAITIPVARRQVAQNPDLINDRGRRFEATLIARRRDTA